MARTRRRPKPPEICVTVEKEGVWLYGNAEAYRVLTKQMARLAASIPSEHHELHVRWYLGPHASKRSAVFVLMDEPSRTVHRRRDFELTFMVVEPSDLKRLRKHERSGRLPRSWDRSI